MLLSVEEAATVLGITPRAVRARLVRGQLPGRKVDGRWRVARESLPLGEAAHQALQARAAELRGAVDVVLPSRGSTRADRRHRSVLDLAAFRAALHARDEAMSQDAGIDVVGSIERGLVALAIAFHEYRAEARLDALTAGRAAFAEAAGRLAVSAPMPPPAARVALLETIERDVLPAMTGLFRRAERAG